MFINRFQAVKASIRRVHATLQPSRVQEYISSSMRQYTVGDSQVRIHHYPMTFKGSDEFSRFITPISQSKRGQSY